MFQFLLLHSLDGSICLPLADFRLGVLCGCWHQPQNSFMSITLLRNVKATYRPTRGHNSTETQITLNLLTKSLREASHLILPDELQGSQGPKGGTLDTRSQAQLIIPF